MTFGRPSRNAPRATGSAATACGCRGSAARTACRGRSPTCRPPCRRRRRPRASQWIAWLQPSRTRARSVEPSGSMSSAPAQHSFSDVDQPGARRAERCLVPRHRRLDHGIVGKPRHVAGRLVDGQRHEGLVHRAGDAERHAGDADRIEALGGEGIERPAVAPQGRVLARAGEFFRHEHVVDGVAFRCRAAHAERVPVADRRALVLGHQQGAHGRPAEAVAAAASRRARRHGNARRSSWPGASPRRNAIRR